MIILLLIILLFAEIFVSVALIKKLNSLKCSVEAFNSKINLDNIKQISNNTSRFVSGINENIYKLIQIKKIRQSEENLKFIISIIISVISFLKKRNKKHK